MSAVSVFPPALLDLAHAEGCEDISTPFIAVDLDAMETNIATMANRFAGHSQRLRPHVKSHKCSEIALLQVRAGACGLTCSTSDELAVLARAGARDLMLANIVTDRQRLRLVAEAARHARVTIVVDSVVGLELVASAARSAGSRVGCLVELDIGMGRNGVQSTHEALALARACDEVDGVRFEGVQAYEGHLVDVPDPDARARQVLEAFGPAVDLVGELRAQGYEDITLAGGSTATYETSLAIPEMTDVQAGTYVLMDATYPALAPEFTTTAALVCSVLTMRRNGDVVVDAGSKRQALDWGVPAWVDGEAEYLYTSEEHSVFRLLGDQRPRVGDRVVLLPAHICTTMAMHRTAFGCRAGRLERGLAIDARDSLA